MKRPPSALLCLELCVIAVYLAGFILDRCIS